MWQLLRRWLGGFLSSARGILSRIAGRSAGRWVEGTYALPHNKLLFFLPQSKRNYRLYVVGRYAANRAWPMVVMLHGCKQDAAVFSSGTRMNELADQEGFLVLYPEQRRLANSFRCWNWFESSAQHAQGEAALIAGMVREVMQNYAIDPGRVYVAGLSAGGAMTSILASCYGELFAACAVHSGLMYGAAESVSEASRAMKNGSRASPEATARKALEQKEFAFVPALVIHGSTDATVHPVNAEQVVEQFIAMASLANGNGTSLSESSSRESGGGRYRYELREYRRGATLLLRKVLVEGLDHAWSGGSPEYPFNDPKGPDASRMIWEFFAGFERRALKASSGAIVN
jgi:poly(hydroxyalkanoate) depolymerase family esterase